MADALQLFPYTPEGDLQRIEYRIDDYARLIKPDAVMQSVRSLAEKLLRESPDNVQDILDLMKSRADLISHPLAAPRSTLLFTALRPHSLKFATAADNLYKPKEYQRNIKQEQKGYEPIIAEQRWNLPESLLQEIRSIPGALAAAKVIIGHGKQILELPEVRQELIDSLVRESQRKNVGPFIEMKKHSENIIAMTEPATMEQNLAQQPLEAHYRSVIAHVQGSKSRLLGLPLTALSRWGTAHVESPGVRETTSIRESKIPSEYIHAFRNAMNRLPNVAEIFHLEDLKSAHIISSSYTRFMDEMMCPLDQQKG